jgi:hypothetical protein
MPVIPALRRQRQEDREFKTSLDYVVRSCLKRKKGLGLWPNGRALAQLVGDPGFHPQYSKKRGWRGEKIFCNHSFKILTPQKIIECLL